MAFSPTRPSRARSGLLHAAALVSMILPACNASFWMDDGIPSHGTNSSTTIINGHVQMVVAWAESGHGYRLEWSGEGMPGVAVGDADFALPSDGDLLLAGYRGGERVAQVRIVSSDGQVAYHFERDGVPMPYQPEGAAWMAEAVPTVITQMGLGASTRIPRLHAADGLDAVLDDIALLQTDMARTRYYEFIVESPDFPSVEVARSVQHASSRIASDAHLAGLLEDAVEARPGDPVLVEGVLGASASIDSDAHLADLLETIVDLGGFGGATATAFLAALGQVQSDAHAADVFEELVENAGLAPGTMALVLSHLGPQIDSDAHLADVLEEVPASALGDGRVRAAMRAALDTIGSEAHRHSVLRSFPDGALND